MLDMQLFMNMKVNSMSPSDFLCFLLLLLLLLFHLLLVLTVKTIHQQQNKTKQNGWKGSDNHNIQVK